LRAFEEPAGADAEAVMPRGESRGVHRESSLACERSSHNFAGRQNRRVFRAEAESFAQLSEMFCLEFLAAQKRADVPRTEMSLLQRELCRAGEGRGYVWI
jgi:hypothetical protein